MALCFLMKLCQIVFCNSLCKFLCTFVLQIILPFKQVENEKLKQHAKRNLQRACGRK